MNQNDILADATMADASGAQYYVEAGAEPFDLTLQANAESRDLSQYFAKDSTFLWTGVAGSQTGLFQVQFQLPDGRLLSSAPVRNSNIIGTAQFPVPIWPAVRIGPNGKIGIATIKDLSGAANTIQIVFLGVRVYLTRGAQQ
jgi:hypothetical protein